MTSAVGQGEGPHHKQVDWFNTCTFLDSLLTDTARQTNRQIDRQTDR